MDAREMLNLPTKYKHIINMRITNAHEMYVQLTSPSMHYGDRIGSPGSRNNTGFVSGLDRIDAYNEETEKLKAEYVAVNHKIENCIFHLENLMEQQILTDLFLHFKTQRETAAKYNYSQRQIQRIRDAGIEHLDEILKKLDARERQLIGMRYFKDMTQTEIAAEMGISQVQVSRMEKRILKELKKQV